VQSLLAQTHNELIVVVVSHGDMPSPWPLLDGINDRRLVRFDLDRDRGSYFAEQVVLQATHDPFLLIQEAEDWSEPTRVERLLRELRRQHAAGAVSSCRLVSAGGSGQIKRWPRLGAPLAQTMERRATHHGLFRTDALRNVGGFHPGFRGGYDTLLINLLEMLDRIVAVDAPLYHARIRPVLLSSAATRCGSASRVRDVRRLEVLYRRAYDAYQQYLDGTFDESRLAGDVRHLVESSTKPADALAVRNQAARLQQRLLLWEDYAADRRSRLNSAGFIQRSAESAHGHELDGVGSQPFQKDRIRQKRSAGAGLTLTPQEHTVALLVAAGQTNREAAETLVVSVKTIEYHLGNAYAKLGVTSRTQLALALQRSEKP
jgi:DNA-binding CsgD family transcriptional regulator